MNFAHIRHVLLVFLFFAASTLLVFAYQRTSVASATEESLHHSRFDFDERWTTALDGGFSPAEPELVPILSDQLFDATAASTKPKIAIIIDDMGLNSRLNHAVVTLPGPLTLAYLPYANQLDSQTGLAVENGHELLVHMPMEPMRETIEPGPQALLSNMNRKEIEAVLDENLSSFSGYVGINNHMGSRLTQDAERMGWIMEKLKERNMFFIDSRTISTSQASDQAHDNAVPYQVRDVFLDHDTSIDAVRKALDKTAAIAEKRGYAIAIGHPKTNTIRALSEWLPTIQEEGFTLVPVSELLIMPETVLSARDESHSPPH